MRFFYHIGLQLYYLGIKLYSPFSHKAALFRSGRKSLFNHLSATITHSSPIIWIHCSSVGEFEQARPIFERIKEEKREEKLLLTFFSPSGYELRKSYNLADWVFYLPIDSPSNAKQFIDIVQPSKVIFIKYEFWYYFLTELKKRAINTYLVSAIFKENSCFFSPIYGEFFRKMLRCYSDIFVQENNSKELLTSINITNVTVSSDTRFDRVAKIALDNCTPAPIEESFSKGKLTLIAGSTWPKDEKLLFKMLDLFPQLQLIIAPHEVEKEHINFILSYYKKYSPLLYTDISSQDLFNITPQSRVLIIDTIGRLSLIYRYGFAAYIGGGFGAGIHNTLEAAVYGIPVLFGPKYEKFKEASELIANGGGFTFDSSKELQSIISKLLNNREFLIQSSNASKEYVLSNKGATEIIYKKIFL